MQIVPVRVFVLALALVPTTAFAHSGTSAGHGFGYGFAHPLTGLDHVLAMITVGLLASQLGGRAFFLLPATFMALMAGGGVLGMAGIGLPAVELGLTISVIVLGAMAALGAHGPRAFAGALVAAFATLHGHAHGVEMPPDSAAAIYALGFLTATALLLASGIAAGSLLGQAAGASGRAACRIGGGAVAVAGIALLAQVI